MASTSASAKDDVVASSKGVPTQPSPELPAELIVKIAECLTDIGGCVGSLRAVSSHFLASLENADVFRLSPLGAPRYARFARCTSIDFTARGHIVTDEDLVQLRRGAGGSLRTLRLSGAFKLTSGLEPLAGLTALTHLDLSESTVQDHHLTVLSSLTTLRCLDLTACAFLTQAALPAIAACPSLHALHLAGCGLALHLHPQAAAALLGLTELEELDVGGCNGVGDEVLVSLAALPRLRVLCLAGAVSLTDTGLAVFSTSPSAPTLTRLDLSACSTLTPSCWTTLRSLPALRSLSFAHLNTFFRYPGSTDAHAVGVWHMPRLTHISLTGSAVHPANLKLLAAGCGSEVRVLDMSIQMPAGYAAGGGDRVSVRFAKDVCEAARYFKGLTSLNVAGVRLTLAAVLAFVRAAPKLRDLDVSGSSLETGAGTPRAQKRLNFGDRHTSVQPTSTYAPHDISTVVAAAAMASGLERDLPCVLGCTDAEFAVALGALTDLQSLKMNACSGLSVTHLQHLSRLSGLQHLHVAHNRGLTDQGVGGVLSSLTCSLKTLDVRHTGAGDGALTRGCVSLSQLERLACAGSGSRVTPRGLHALADAGAGRHLRSLELEGCAGVGDSVLCVLGSRFQTLSQLSLGGCSGVTPAGVAALSPLIRLQQLNLNRCGGAVDDASLAAVCGSLTRLTRLSIAEAAGVTAAGLRAVSALQALAALNLMCCAGVGDDGDLEKGLEGVTNANVQLPQGRRGGGTGSPIKRQAAFM